MVAFASVPALRHALYRATRTCTAPAARVRYGGISQLRMLSAPPAGEDTVMATVERKLTDALSPEKLVVTPTYDDPNGSHVSIYVVSDIFEGDNVVKRHRKIYSAIWDELQGPIHAVDSLIAKTPAEEQKA